VLPASLTTCLAWYRGEGPPASEQYCETRDAFDGRLGRLLRAATGAGLAQDDAQLLTAVAGELGSNAYDHNLGHWRDQPGCCFGDEASERGILVWVADRGRGVLASLVRVAPYLATHQQALELAFEKVISGRQPERRGNGLKFVRTVINGHADRGLVTLSGNALLAFGGRGSELRSSLPLPQQEHGVMSVIDWRTA
jgi:hypothetical protein